MNNLNTPGISHADMNIYALSNCTLWAGDGSERSGHVVISGDRITAVGDGPYVGDLPVEDLQGNFLSPGLIDIMLGGAFGATFFHGDAERLLSEYIKTGVTSCQMCCGCQPWSTIEQIAETVRACRAGANNDSATLLGAGEPDGDFLWDDGRTFTKANHVHRTEEGFLAGSGLLLPDHLRNFCRITGVLPYEAIRMVTLNPAACLGLENEIGLLAEGRKADLALWNDRLQLQGVWKNSIRLKTISDMAEISF